MHTYPLSQSLSLRKLLQCNIFQYNTQNYINWYNWYSNISTRNTGKREKFFIENFFKKCSSTFIDTACQKHHSRQAILTMVFKAQHIPEGPIKGFKYIMSHHRYTGTRERKIGLSSKAECAHTLWSSMSITRWTWFIQYSIDVYTPGSYTQKSSEWHHLYW